MNLPYDALLIVAFGGPERREDVMPFLENVLRGRHVPRERLEEVASHYDHFGGVSPLNAQVRELRSALRLELESRGIRLPLFWGNRNWTPFLADALKEMAASGIRRALAVVLSAYSSYSGCRQYLENIADAREAAGPGAPQVDKIRAFYNHPRFVAANADRLAAALRDSPRAAPHVAFTAHSIPESMAAGCEYVRQLEETCRLTAEAAGVLPEQWQLVYQSRSGRPADPWLEPDLGDHLRSVHAAGVRCVVIMPIGFLSDHLEVLYDLDVEARRLCTELGLSMVRAATVGTHPQFVAMLAELIEERLDPRVVRRTLGRFGPSPDICPPECCPRVQG